MKSNNIRPVQMNELFHLSHNIGSIDRRRHKKINMIYKPFGRNAKRLILEIIGLSKLVLTHFFQNQGKKKIQSDFIKLTNSTKKKINK